MLIDAWYWQIVADTNRNCSFSIDYLVYKVKLLVRLGQAISQGTRFWQYCVLCKYYSRAIDSLSQQRNCQIEDTCADRQTYKDSFGLGKVYLLSRVELCIDFPQDKLVQVCRTILVQHQSDSQHCMNNYKQDT